LNRRRPAALLVLLAAAAPSARLAAEEVPRPSVAIAEPEGGFAIGPSFRTFFAKLEGKGYSDQDYVEGTTIRFGGDLGLDTTAPLYEIGLIGGWWETNGKDSQLRYGFEVRYLGGHYTEHATLGSTAVYDGTVFAAGESVTSTFDIDLTYLLSNASMQWGDGDRFVQVGGFFGFPILGARLKMEGNSGSSGSSGLTTGMIGGGVRFVLAPCPWFDIGGEAGAYGGYFSYHYYEDEQYEESSWLVDLSIRGSLRPWKYAAVEFGYRFLEADLYMNSESYHYDHLHQEREFLRWTLQGPFVGATIRF
jgi:hypothetical protein